MFMYACVVTSRGYLNSSAPSYSSFDGLQAKGQRASNGVRIIMANLFSFDVIESDLAALQDKYHQGLLKMSWSTISRELGKPNGTKIVIIGTNLVPFV